MRVCALAWLQRRAHFVQMGLLLHAYQVPASMQTPLSGPVRPSTACALCSAPWQDGADPTCLSMIFMSSVWDVEFRKFFGVELLISRGDTLHSLSLLSLEFSLFFLHCDRETSLIAEILIHLV